MVRTPKSSKGFGFGRRKGKVKKTAAQKQAEASGRLWRSVIEGQVRQENPRKSEKYISAESRRRMAARKPKPISQPTPKKEKRKKEWWEM